MHFIYIIQSQTSGKFYCGECADLSDRLARHNEDRSKSTKGKGPWTLVKTIQCLDRSEARIIERKIKGRGIGRFLEENP